MNRMELDDKLEDFEQSNNLSKDEKKIASSLGYVLAYDMDDHLLMKDITVDLINSHPEMTQDEKKLAIKILKL